MAEELIETVRFGGWDTDGPDLFDAWSQHSSSHVLERRSEHFRAEVAFWILDGVVVSAQRLAAFAGARTPERLAALPTNQVTVVAVLEGTMAYRAGGVGAAEVAGAGDAVLLDMRRVYDFEVTEGRTIVISLDRGTLEDAVGPLALAGVMPRNLETGMLIDFADALARRLPGMAASSAAPLASATRHLMIAAVRRRHSLAHAEHRSARANVVAYMEVQPPGSLDVEEMAKTLQLTRATLYRLFRGDGGVVAFDRRRRLRLLHRALTDDQIGEPLSELGTRYGFFDPSNLSRQFRQQFGLSMSDVRRHLLPRVGATGPARRYREAVERFS